MSWRQLIRMLYRMSFALMVSAALVWVSWHQEKEAREFWRREWNERSAQTSLSLVTSILSSRPLLPDTSLHWSWPHVMNYPNVQKILQLDRPFRDGLKNEYQFKLVLSESNIERDQGEDGNMVFYHTWSATAWPLRYPEAGMKSFYIDQTGFIIAADLQGAPMLDARHPSIN